MKPDRHRLEVVFLKAAERVTDDLGQFQEKFTKSLARKLTADWNDAAEAAVAAGVAALRRRRGINHVTEAVAASARKFSKKADVVLKTQVRTFFHGAITRFLREIALPVAKAKRSGPGINFSLRDQKAITALADLTANAASRYFPDQLKPKVAEVVTKVVLNEGLTPDEAAKELETELRGALGVISETLPSQFKQNPSAYFRIIANQTATLANSVGRILAMDDAGVEKFEIVAVLDDRTSAICRSLHGRTIPVSSGARTIDRLMEFKGVRQIENLLPFTARGDANPPSWAASVGFPPYHHGPCRTQVIPIVE